ncbi:hypothetical protein [Halobacillus salinus]|uniref:hypothetical protein n=1 Tax=Halobacillus salinus TaxID=192814 RepID=UPI0009A66A42|nr:hypothetical protein [Halobacillus salinus]
MRAFFLVIALIVNLLYISLSLFGLDTWLGIRVGTYNVLFGILLVSSFIFSLIVFLKGKRGEAGSVPMLSLVVLFLSVGTLGWYAFLNVLGLSMGGF